MKNLNTRVVFSAIGLALSIAVLVILIVSDEPDLKSMVMLLALSMVAQSMTIFDKLGESNDSTSENEQ
ncbi:MAG: hypothetical protein MJZ81_00805 [Bacteroidales bacterium]|nr:hypothetical protein [Bacteroidales bacterium]